MTEKTQNPQLPVSKTPADLIIGISLGVLFLLFTWPWIYKGGFGEPDSTAIAVGIQQAIQSGQNFGGALLYLPSGHPLYYFSMFHIPGAGSWSIDKVIWVMNHCSWLAMGASMAIFYLLCRRVSSRGWSLTAAALLFTCPVFIDQSTYGHPVSVALLIFLAAALLLVEGLVQICIARTRASVIIFASALLLAASVCIRADIIFFFPALIPLTFYVGANRKSALLAVAGTCAFALLAFLIARSMVTRSVMASTTASLSPTQQARAFLVSYYHLKSVVKGMIYFPLATGLGIFLVLIITTVFLAKRKLWSLLFAGALMVIPTFLFYVGNPLPSRHFLHASVGICLFLALVGSRAIPLKTKGVVWFALILAGINLGFAPSLATLTKVAKIPTRNWLVQRLTVGVFDWHRMYQDYLNWDQARWKSLVPTLSEKTLMIGGWLENNGLYVHIAREGSAIKSKPMDAVSANAPTCISYSDRNLFFLGYDPSQPLKIPSGTFQAIIIVAFFPPEQQKTLPQGTLNVYPWRTQYLIF